MASEPATQHARQQKVVVSQPIIDPDYLALAQTADEQVLQENTSNPIYNLIIENDKNLTNEAAIQEAYEILVSGLEGDNISTDQFDENRRNLTNFNAYMQAMRRQLGSDQIKGITEKDYADFQKIIRTTREDVGKFSDQLTPLFKLQELLTKFGAEGNIIEKLNKAVAQKRIREEKLATWQFAHRQKLQALQQVVNNLKGSLLAKDITLKQKAASTFAYFNARARLSIEAEISQLNKDLEERSAQLAAAEAEEPDAAIAGDDTGVETVDPEILQLQDIGGEPFKNAIIELRSDSAVTLAKISSNFDEAIAGLNRSREFFINLDRNCGDANIALTILEIAVQRAEEKAKEVANKIVEDMDKGGDSDLIKLNRMEKERRSQQILGYKDFLSSFLMDLGIAVSSIRSGQTGIQNILRMNAAALQSANTHKMTGMANTSDAVAIIIGSIIDESNRASSRILTDGLNAILSMSREGNKHLAQGTSDALKIQNEQLQSILTSVTDLTAQTRSITENSVDLLVKQLTLMEGLRKEGEKLSVATDEANRMRLTVAASDAPVEEKKPVEHHQGFTIRRHQ